MGERALSPRLMWLAAADLASVAVGAPFPRVVEPPTVVGRGSDARTTMARQIAFWLLTDLGRLSLNQAACASGFHRSTVSKQAHKCLDAFEGDHPADLAAAAEACADEFGRLLAAAA